MALQKTGSHSIGKIYNNTLKSFKSNPALILPFLIFAVIESLVLIIIFLVPRVPFRAVLGPPIRTLWGEGYLHYPFNFLLLPKLASNSRMALSILFASLLSGSAVFMVWDVYNRKHAKLTLSLKSALKKYFSLFFIVFLLVISYYALMKVLYIGLVKYFLAGHSRLLFLKANLWLGPILTIAAFVLAILIQSLFIYAIPVLIIEKEKLLKSIFKSFVLFKKLFVPTVILVGLPMLIYIPIIVLNQNVAFLIDRVFPEFVLVVAFLGTVLSSLVIDPLVTVSTTILYLKNKENS